MTGRPWAAKPAGARHSLGEGDGFGDGLGDGFGDGLGVGAGVVPGLRTYWDQSTPMMLPGGPYWHTYVTQPQLVFTAQPMRWVVFHTI